MDHSENDKHLLSECIIKIKDTLHSGLTSDAKGSWEIDRVPSDWRGVHSDAFDPQMVRIGPLSYPNELHDLSVMSAHKRRFLIRLLGGVVERQRSHGDVSRTTEGERVSDDSQRGEDHGDNQKAVLLDDLVEAMRILMEKAKACYKNNRMSDVDFVITMVVDGCFVVELLRLYYHLFAKSTGKAIGDDPILAKPQILTTLRRDLLLLENQLPFFVLEKLYELINKNNIDQQAVPLEVLAVTFFDPLFPGHDAATKLDTKEPKAHLLDVFRSTFLKSMSEKVHKKGKNGVRSRLDANGSMRGIVLHFATELREAGVRFKKRKGHDLLDIKFGHRTLWVPPLSLNDNTISLLLNFVAYELSVTHPKPFFMNYFMFWDSLINSPTDIQILHKQGIINSSGIEKEVAELLMRCREVIYDLDLGYFYNEIKEVNDYCQRHYESKYRVLWRKLFRGPWTWPTFVASAVLMLLTGIQTLYTVFSYHRPP